MAVEKVDIHRGYFLLWFFKKIYLWSKSIFALRKEDVVFAFYPKTGSTWVRIFFYNLYSNDNAVFTFKDINRVMPEFGNKNHFGKWPFSYPKMIKTHRRYFSFYSRNKIILFTREPRDTMVSLLHYVRARKVYSFEGTLKDLIRDEKLGLNAYFKFYSSWVKKADLIIRYEDLRENPIECYGRILNTLGVEKSNEEIEKALNKSSLENTREAQRKSEDYFGKNFNRDFVFARKGVSGEGKFNFDEKDNIYLQDLRKQYNFSLY